MELLNVCDLLKRQFVISGKIKSMGNLVIKNVFVFNN